MSVFGAALITFFALMLLTWHMRPGTKRKVAGYALPVDLLVHGTVIYLFFGTSTLGLMQAELSAIFFTVALRTYRYLHGYERLVRGHWVRFAGRINSQA